MEHPSVTQSLNPLISRVRIPGQTFPLPSGGIFYKNGELAANVVNGEVHVYPMTAIDELVIKSVDKVFSGAAVREIFARCIPDILQPGKLSAKDIDYLLVALRKVSYGAEFTITYKHSCEDAKDHEYSASLDTFLQGTKTLNPVTMREAFTHKLPNGQAVQFIPASYDDVVEMYQIQHAELSAGKEVDDEESLERILKSVCILIGQVDDITNREHIIEWLKSIPIAWLRDVSIAAQDTTEWGITFEVNIKCKDCGEVLDIPTPLNPISFFI